MAGTTTTKIERGVLHIENNDMLKPVHGGKAKEFLTFSIFQVRTEMDIKAFLPVAKTFENIKEAVKGEAEKFEKNLQKKVTDLVSELEKLSVKDKAGDDKAGEQASKKVKDTSDDMEEDLPEFGKRMRKFLEAKFKTKLPGGIRSASSGQFKGLKLKKDAFQSGANLAETFKDFKDAAKSLDDEAKEAVAQCAELNKSLPELKKTFVDEFTKTNNLMKTTPTPAKTAGGDGNDAADKKSAAGGKPPEVVNSVYIKKQAGDLSKLAEEFFGKLGEMQEALKKVSTEYDKQQKDLKEDLASDQLKTRRESLKQFGTQLADFKREVDTKVTETKHIPSDLKAAESFTKPADWLMRLSAVRGQISRFTPPNATKFGDALKKMNTEGQKTA